jgi:hypothetical protein
MAPQRDHGKVRSGLFGLGMMKRGHDYPLPCGSNGHQRPASGITHQSAIDSNEAARMYGGVAYTTYTTKNKATDQRYNDTNSVDTNARRMPTTTYSSQFHGKNEYRYNYYKFTATTIKEDNRLRMVYKVD